jgi:hypothetical protein
MDNLQEPPEATTDMAGSTVDRAVSEDVGGQSDTKACKDSAPVTSETLGERLQREMEERIAARRAELGNPPEDSPQKTEDDEDVESEGSISGLEGASDGDSGGW